jgi:hypothetical protein
MVEFKAAFLSPFCLRPAADLQPRDGVHTIPAGLDQRAVVVPPGIALTTFLHLGYIIPLFPCLHSSFPHVAMAAQIDTHLPATPLNTISDGTKGDVPASAVQQIQSGLPGFVLEHGQSTIRL